MALSHKNLSHKNLPSPNEELTMGKFLKKLFTNLNQKLTPTQHLEFTLQPFLAECRCNYFSRLHDRRRKLEEQLIQKIQAQFPVALHKTLTVLSLGSGKLLQDFIICYKLLLLGYSLEIFLIDPHNNRPDYQNALRQFKLLVEYADQQHVKLFIDAFQSIHDMVDSGKKINVDVVSSIDMLTIPHKDFILAHSLLKKDGIFLSAFHMYDIFLSKLKSISLVRHDYHKPYENLVKEEIAFVAELPLQAQVFKTLTKKFTTTDREIQPVEKEKIAELIIGYAGFFAKKSPQVNLLKHNFCPRGDSQSSKQLRIQ